MKLSQHNIISKIQDSSQYFIINPLSGNADIFDEKTYEQIRQGNYPNQEELVVKGYLVDENEEKKIYRAKYLQSLDERESDEIQLFFVPSYACNFACSYCYQDEYLQQQVALSFEVVDAFFDYIQKQFSGRRKYITLFGGEPLLPGKQRKELLTYFIDQANQYQLEIAVVTNGYTLIDYLDLLKSARVREIQITLDGSRTVHDNRRFLKGGKGTFDRIAAGIDQLLENNIPVNLRAVIDRENLENLPELASFATEKGWTKSRFFKTQLGRNYELHHCQTEQNRLYSRLEMYQDLYLLLKSHPEVAEFYQPAFSISKFLWENGELPAPLFDSCPGAKTEWAFDYSGGIFACTASRANH